MKKKPVKKQSGKAPKGKPKTSVKVKTTGTPKAPKAQKCQWTVTGANWQWIHKGHTEEDPTELATIAIEQLYGKKDRSLGGDKILCDDPDDQGMGFILIIEHSKMRQETDKLAVYSPHILANAGFYRLAEDIRKMDADLEEI